MCTATGHRVGTDTRRSSRVVLRRVLRGPLPVEERSHHLGVRINRTDRFHHTVTNEFFNSVIKVGVS